MGGTDNPLVAGVMGPPVLDGILVQGSEASSEPMLAMPQSSSARRRNSTQSQQEPLANDSLLSNPDAAPPTPSNASTATARPASLVGLRHSGGRRAPSELSGGTSPWLAPNNYRRKRALSNSATLPQDDDTSSLVTLNQTPSGHASTAAANSDIGFGPRVQPRYTEVERRPPFSSHGLPSPREQLQHRKLMIDVSTGGFGEGMGVSSSNKSPKRGPSPVKKNSLALAAAGIRKQAVARWSPTWKEERRLSRSTSPHTSPDHSTSSAPYGSSSSHCAVPMGDPSTAPDVHPNPVSIPYRPPSPLPVVRARPPAYRRVSNIWQVMSPVELRIFAIALVVYFVLMLSTFLGGLVTAAVLSKNMLGEAGNQCNRYVPVVFLVLLVLLAITIVAMGSSGGIVYKREWVTMVKGRRMSSMAIFLLTIMSLLLLCAIAIAFYSLFIANEDDEAQKNSCGVAFEGLRGTAIATIILGLGGVFAYMVFYSFLTRRLHVSWSREARG